MDDSKGYFFFITAYHLQLFPARKGIKQVPNNIGCIDFIVFNNCNSDALFVLVFFFYTSIFTLHNHVNYIKLPDISLSRSIRMVKLQANIFNADKVRQVIQTMNMTLSNVYLHYHAVSSNFNSEIRHGNTHTHNRQTYLIIARYVISGTKFAYPLRELS